MFKAKSMPIIIAPNAILSTPCVECELGNKEIELLGKRMARTMYENNGCGIAAPQVGESKRIIVIDCGEDSDKENPIYMVNPKVVETRGEMVEAEEGCLSLPGISVAVSRPEWARVEFFDLKGNRGEASGSGLFARCVQHECDHLDGKTMLEACTPMARLKGLHDYQEALASGARPGQTSLD